MCCGYRNPKMIDHTIGLSAPLLPVDEYSVKAQAWEGSYLEGNKAGQAETGFDVSMCKLKILQTHGSVDVSYWSYEDHGQTACGENPPYYDDIGLIGHLGFAQCGMWAAPDALYKTIPEFYSASGVIVGTPGFDVSFSFHVTGEHPEQVSKTWDYDPKGLAHLIFHFHLKPGYIAAMSRRQCLWRESPMG